VLVSSQEARSAPPRTGHGAAPSQSTTARAASAPARSSLIRVHCRVRPVCLAIWAMPVVWSPGHGADQRGPRL